MVLSPTLGLALQRNVSCHIWVRLVRISISRLRFFRLTDQFGNTLTNRCKDSLMTSLQILDRPPHKCAAAISPECVFLHKLSYIESSSLEWAWRERELGGQVCVGK